MSVHDVQEELGQTGRFGETFVGLGALILFYGTMMLLSGAFGFPFFPLTGNEGFVGLIQTAGLFVLEGIGFVLFGVVAIRAGWARNHPEADL